MFTPIPLTVEQIRVLDELNFDAAGIDQALKIALNYAANAINRIEKEKRKFWKDLDETHGLHIATQQYTVKQYEGKVCICLEEKEDVS